MAEQELPIEKKPKSGAALRRAFVRADVARCSLAMALAVLFPLFSCKNAENRRMRERSPSQDDAQSPLQPLESLKPGQSSNPQPGFDGAATQSLGDVCCTFPFPDRKILDDFNTGGRSFGAGRGGRKHAATDLLKEYRTSIHAIADGEILDVHEFYEGTDAVVVDHQFFVARYGEIKSLASDLNVGSRVKKGQKIAEVGRLAGSGYSMLHLELYKGTLKGALTTPGNAYQRRADLFDPSGCVRLWMKTDSQEKCWEKASVAGGN